MEPPKNMLTKATHATHVKVRPTQPTDAGKPQTHVAHVNTWHPWFIEIGQSGFNKMKAPILNMFDKRLAPKIIINHNNQKFSNEYVGEKFNQ